MADKHTDGAPKYMQVFKKLKKGKKWNNGEEHSNYLIRNSTTNAKKKMNSHKSVVEILKKEEEQNDVSWVNKKPFLGVGQCFLLVSSLVVRLAWVVICSTHGWQ